MEESVKGQFWLDDSVKETFENYFDIGKILGCGPISVVCGCTHKQTQKQYAVKIIPKNPEKKTTVRQLECLLRLQHPNITAIYEVYETPTEIQVVTDIATGGDLLERITTVGEYTEREVAGMVKEILQGLMYLHDSGITHRSLRFQNILYSNNEENGRIQLTDYHLSLLLSQELWVTTTTTSVAFAAPELLRNMESLTQAADMWALGVLTYYMLSGLSPFGNCEKVFKRILKGDYTFDADPWSCVSWAAKDFIQKLLRMDPRQRPTVRQLLVHSWLRKTPKSANLDVAQENLKYLNHQRKKQNDEALGLLRERCMSPGGTAIEQSSFDVRAVLQQMMQETGSRLTPMLSPSPIKPDPIATIDQLHEIQEAAAFTVDDVLSASIRSLQIDNLVGS